MSLQESGEMYLETIYILSQKSSEVRSLDVAEYMGFSKPSVCRAVGLLKSGGYISSNESGHLFLTEEGEKIASKMYERHVLLSRFLMELGVDEKTAVSDACKVEHYLSDRSFTAIRGPIEKYMNKHQNEKTEKI